MPREKLRRLLSQLHDELADAPPMEDSERVLLRNIARDIKTVLDSGGDVSTDADEPNLTESLGEAAVQFEASHPRLVTIISQISDLLRTIGIR
jgi:hypothetical protein